MCGPGEARAGNDPQGLLPLTAVKPFAELLDRLLYTPQRNAKIALLVDYFRAVPDPDRGWGLAALTGALSFAQAKPGLIRELVAGRTDPVLFGWSYDFVGDLAETAALMWPEPEAGPALAAAGRGGGGAGDDAQGRAARHGRRLARHAGRHRPLGAAEAGHRRAARRRLGAARQAGAGRVWRGRRRPRSRRSGTG